MIHHCSKSFSGLVIFQTCPSCLGNPELKNKPQIFVYLHWLIIYWKATLNMPSMPKMPSTLFKNENGVDTQLYREKFTKEVVSIHSKILFECLRCARHF